MMFLRTTLVAMITGEWEILWTHRHLEMLGLTDSPIATHEQSVV